MAKSKKEKQLSKIADLVGEHYTSLVAWGLDSNLVEELVTELHKALVNDLFESNEELIDSVKQDVDFDKFVKIDKPNETKKWPEPNPWTDPWATPYTVID